MNSRELDKYIDKGRHDVNWYERQEKVFIELFGPKKLELVTNLFAATSINSSLRSNITLFRRALYEIENGLPIGNYLPGIQLQLERVRNGKELSGRKINSFAKAMRGDKNSVVVDIWLLRAFGMDRQYKRNTGPHAGTFRSGGATDKQYSLIEEYVRWRAYLKGLEPRQLSAIIWSGTRIHFNGDRETNYENILRFQIYNMYDSTR